MAIIEKGNNLTGNVVLCAPIAMNEVIEKKTLTKGDVRMNVQFQESISQSWLIIILVG